MKRFTSLLLLLWVALGTFASGFESNNIYYIITDESRKTVEVSGGSNDLHYKEKDVVIPSEVIYNGTSYTVTRIGNDAFNQWNLTGIKIPNSVESIGDNAFCNCLNLTTITIPNSVKTIGRRAFGATGLVSVYIPSNVTSISTEAFAPCFYIESITVASDNPVYDSRNNCNAIIQTSNNTLIQGCQNTIIPDDITQLSDGAFVGSLITSVTIPQSIVNIGTDVFAMCPLLTSMSVAEGNPVFDSRENCNAIIHTSTNTLIQGCTGSTIPNSITSIGDRAFISRLLESITIPESVVSIGESAFSSCIDLKSIDIPNNVKSIGSYAFSSCSELKTVKIGSGVKIIPYSVFSYCYELTDVIIAEGVERIESHAFSGNSQLTNITIPKSVTYIDSEALTWTPWHTAYINNPDNCYGNIVYINDIAYKAVNRDITSCVFKNSTITISPEAFGGCTKLTSVTIPEKVTCIPNSTFDGCSNLSSIIIPNSISSIGHNAFRNTPWFESYVEDPDNIYGNIVYIHDVAVQAVNKDITSCSFKESTCSISEYAFYMCTNLESVDLPNSITMIGKYTFEGCKNLVKVTIPSSITNIERSVFSWCEKLQEVTCLALNAPTIGVDVFYGTKNSEGTLYVPHSAVDMYKSADGWKEWGNIVGVGPQPATDISKYDNILYVEPTEAKVGTQVTLSVKMKNTAKVQTIGVYVKLPEGVSVAKNAKNQYMISLSSERTDADCHQLSRSFVDGIYRVGILGTAGLPFDGNDGEVFTMTLNIPSDMAEGDYDIEMTEMEMTDTNNKSYNVSYYRGILKVEDYVDGDANGDDKVTMADASIVTNFFLGNATDGIVLKAADVNGDGKVTMADANIITNMFLGNY